MINIGLRDIPYLLRHPSWFLDAAATLAFCWSFDRLRKRYYGGTLPTTVSGDYADAEPCIYDVTPWLSRNRAEVDIYADVSCTAKRAVYWHNNGIEHVSRN